MLQGNRTTKFQERHSDVGRFIAALCRQSDAPADYMGLLNEKFYHHTVASCPRGKLVVFSSLQVFIMFQIVLCRGLYLVDSLSAFHPFSQVSISISHTLQLPGTNKLFIHFIPETIHTHIQPFISRDCNEV
jgi:hypothetical protein